MENNEQLVKQNEKKIYTIERVEPKNNIVYCFTKRFLDIFLSIVVLVVLSLPMIIIAIIIRLDSPGPAFFRQDRLGKNGKTFIMYKYRTMYTDAEKDGPQWAKENDSRCTKVGLYLRKTRIDELPQFINVLKGEMSLVGPRPEREYFYDKFETYIKGFRYRLAVLPGITGLAQVNGGYNLLPEEKIVYDMEYIRNMSFTMDLYCFLKTFLILFTSDGAR